MTGRGSTIPSGVIAATMSPGHDSTMPETELARAEPTSIGALLRYWRNQRRLSQLDLSFRAKVSPRHVSFLETGRSRPSREMVLQLAGALEVPMREQNLLLRAAGFAPIYTEMDLDAPELKAVRDALEAILEQQAPYPAVVMDRHWNVLMTNPAAMRFFSFLLSGVVPEGRPNVIHMMFDPELARPFIVNWEDAGGALIDRIHREALGGVRDEGTTELLEAVFEYPDIPARWRRPRLGSAPVPVLPVEFRKDGLSFRYFSTISTLGTPQDVTLQELRIECFFPADPGTIRNARDLAAQRTPVRS
jgi:transcriptional regulator with XRE-family HTH domain